MIRYSSFILAISLALTACSSQTADKSPAEEKTTDSAIQPITEVLKDSIISADTFLIPTKSFLELVSIVDSAGFTADTNRIKKVEYYYCAVKRNPVFVVNHFPFYKMDKEKNPVFNYLLRHARDTFSYSKKSMNYFEDSISKAYLQKRVFDKFITITGYFFRDKVSPSENFGELTTDGFIEEWEFNNPGDAKSAEKALLRICNRVYFNSYAQVIRKDNHLYTFYSRSDWDTRRLGKLYKQLIKKLNPDSWTTSLFNSP